MAVLANPQYFELEQDDEAEQVLVAARFVGDARKYSGSAPVNQGRWPDNQIWLEDQWYVAFVPERVPENDSGAGVAWFERAGSFEVEFDPERIAEILVDRNYVDLQPGGPIGDGDTVPGFWGKLEDALGIEDEIEAGESYADQLEALAGVDDSPATAESDPVDAMVNEYGRGDLKDKVKAAREDADEFSLRGASMQDMAEYLVDQEVTE